MWFLNEMYTAQQAYEMGLVNKVVPAAELDAAVKAWTDILAERSPTALALAKRSFNADSENIRGISLASLQRGQDVLRHRGIERGRSRVQGEAQARLPQICEVATAAAGMAPARIEPNDIAAVLPRGGRRLVLACSGESLLLADAVMRAGEALGAMTFTGIFVPGLNTRTYLANPPCSVETFFLTPELKAAGEAVTFLPLCYSDILARLRTVPIDAALFMATPPDARDFAALARSSIFSPSFGREFRSASPISIRPLPRVSGGAGIPLCRTHRLCRGRRNRCWASRRGRGRGHRRDRAKMSRVRSPTAPRLQTGLGKIPTAVLRALRGQPRSAHPFRTDRRSRRRSRGGRRAGGGRRRDGRRRDRFAASLRARRRPAYRFRPVSLHPFAARHRRLRKLRLDQFGDGGRFVRPGLCRDGPWRPDVRSGRRFGFCARRLVRRRPAGSSPCRRRPPRAPSAALSRRTRALARCRSAGWTPTSS